MLLLRIKKKFCILIFCINFVHIITNTMTKTEFKNKLESLTNEFLINVYNSNKNHFSTQSMIIGSLAEGELIKRGVNL